MTAGQVRILAFVIGLVSLFGLKLAWVFALPFGWCLGILVLGTLNPDYFHYREPLWVLKMRHLALWEVFSWARYREIKLPLSLPEDPNEYQIVAAIKDFDDVHLDRFLESLTKSQLLDLENFLGRKCEENSAFWNFSRTYDLTKALLIFKGHVRWTISAIESEESQTSAEVI